MNARITFVAGALAAGVAFANLFVAPAYAGNGNDARAAMVQAQIHPMMTNQYPTGVAPAPFDAAEADLVPGFHGAQAYVAAPSQAARTRAKKLRALSVDPRQQF